MTTSGPRYLKSASSRRTPGGVYAAQVSQVDGVDVYVTVPRLTHEFEHGPIVYTGDVPTVGDFCFVHLLEGRQDDVVAIFPGGSGGGGGTEPSFLVAASDALQQWKDVADWVCDGTNDEFEIQAALDALPVAGGRVFLTEGTFDFGGTTGEVDVTMSSNQSIQGVGPGTLIAVTSSSGEAIIQASNWQGTKNVQILNMRFDFAGATPSFDGIYLDCPGGIIDGCIFTGMGQSGSSFSGYLLLDYDARATNCDFSDIYVGGC